MSVKTEVEDMEVNLSDVGRDCKVLIALSSLSWIFLTHSYRFNNDNECWEDTVEEVSDTIVIEGGTDSFVLEGEKV